MVLLWSSWAPPSPLPPSSSLAAGLVSLHSQRSGGRGINSVEGEHVPTLWPILS